MADGVPIVIPRFFNQGRAQVKKKSLLSLACHPAPRSPVWMWILSWSAARAWVIGRDDLSWIQSPAEGRKRSSLAAGYPQVVGLAWPTFVPCRDSDSTCGLLHLSAWLKAMRYCLSPLRGFNPPQTNAWGMIVVLPGVHPLRGITPGLSRGTTPWFSNPSSPSKLWIRLRV